MGGAGDGGPDNAYRRDDGVKQTRPAAGSPTTTAVNTVPFSWGIRENLMSRRNKRQSSGGGFRSTLLTGGGGLPNSANTSGNTLLGG